MYKRKRSSGCNKVHERKETKKSWLIINKRTALGRGSKDRKRTGITTITERLNKEYELRN